MGDAETEEDMRGQDVRAALWQNGTEAITSSDLSISHENHKQKLMTRGATDWPAQKHHMMDNNPEERSENKAIKFSLDDGASGNSPPGPSPAVLAALTSLGEHSNHMLLPHSLHQMAETYFLEGDYQWADRFLCLEKLYHERLLFNLASMQKDWAPVLAEGKQPYTVMLPHHALTLAITHFGSRHKHLHPQLLPRRPETESRWKAISQARNCSPVKILCSETETKHMNSLNLICRTHQRPNRSLEKHRTTESIAVEQTPRGNPFKMKDWTEQPQSDPEEDNEDEAEDREEDLEVARRQQLSDNEMTELIEVQETFPSNGLVSILKKRTYPEESSPVPLSPTRSSSKFKVRFSEADDLQDNDEGSEDSCLFFLVLCLVTVVISMGGTMLYCFLGGVYANICTDFSHNVDFYFGFVRRVVGTLTRWIISISS